MVPTTKQEYHTYIRNKDQQKDKTPRNPALLLASPKCLVIACNSYMIIPGVHITKMELKKR